MTTLITDQDFQYMKNFPAAKKNKIMQEIMSRDPVAERQFEGNTHCAKAILRLRADGLRLIDLQSLESAFTSVWYRRSNGFLNRGKPEVAALVVWECSDGNDDDVTTLKVWQI